MPRVVTCALQSIGNCGYYDLHSECGSEDFTFSSTWLCFIYHALLCDRLASLSLLPTYPLSSFKQTGVEQNTPAILSAASFLFASHFPSWSPLPFPPPSPCKCQPSHPAIKGSSVAAGSTQTWLLLSHHTTSHKERNGRHGEKHLHKAVQMNKLKRACSALAVCRI